MIKRIMVIFIAIILALVFGVVIFMQTPRFGKKPTGDRLARIEKSPNYSGGKFQNINETPMLTEGVNYLSMLKEFLFKKVKEPAENLPSLKTDIINLDPDEDVLIWIGHSSYFIQLNGKKFLVDPVMSGNASPVFFTTKAFKGSDIYSHEDFPEIDYLLITHDHWDHLDYNSVLELKPKIGKIICPLGNGEHFEHWGFNKTMIIEEDWYKSVSLDKDFTVSFLPARHFSGRSFKRNQALWSSFALISDDYKIYIGGDSGYDTHFSDIASKFGDFDLAILENGQYDTKWKYIHMLPDQVIKAASDLNAKTLLPVHSGKFTLANHDWDEPLNEITRKSNETQTRIITPMIGEKVMLRDINQEFSFWWKSIK